MSADKKIFNLGKSVSTKAFGEIRISEFCLDDFFTLTEELAELSSFFMGLGGAADPAEVFSSLLKEPRLRHALYVVIACAVQKDVNEVMKARITISDLGKLVEAIQEVNDWEVWKKSFFPIVEKLAEFISTTKAPATTTSP